MSFLVAGCASGVGGGGGEDLDLEQLEPPWVYSVRSDDYRYGIEAAVWKDGRVLRLRAQSRLANSYVFGRLERVDLEALDRELQGSWPEIATDPSLIYIDIATRTLHVSMEHQASSGSWPFAGFPDKTAGGKFIDRLFDVPIRDAEQVRLRNIVYPRSWANRDGRSSESLRTTDSRQPAPAMRRRSEK